MKESLHIIALRTVKWTDKHSILSAYTLEHGRMSFLQPAGKGPEASRRRALMMPLGLVEAVADLRAGREIHTLGQARPLAPLAQLRSNPIKSLVAMFLAEVLQIVLREQQTDVGLWHFIEKSVVTLDALDGKRVANFHICFLMKLGALIGIEPDMDSWREGSVFDMPGGIFRMSAPIHGHYLNMEQSALVHRLERMNYLNMHLYRLTREERGLLLDGILRYYSMHYALLGNLKSLDVLRGLL